jgi:hypothetical protein
VAWNWVEDDDRRLIVVNLSDRAVQARVRLSWKEVAGAKWRLTDAFSDWSCDRDGDETADPGLYIELKAWGYYFFSVSVVTDPVIDFAG